MTMTEINRLNAMLNGDEEMQELAKVILRKEFETSRDWDYSTSQYKALLAGRAYQLGKEEGENYLKNGKAVNT